MGEPDLQNRDPNQLNEHLKVGFDDVLGEPEDAHSMDFVWTHSYKCFNLWTGLCYKILTVVCGIPLAVCWGCEFACITFSHVWQITPCMRAYMIQCDCAQKFFSTCVKCYIQPLAEALGYIFYNIRITKEG